MFALSSGGITDELQTEKNSEGSGRGLSKYHPDNSLERGNP
jgi:hypothetical protein